MSSCFWQGLMAGAIILFGVPITLGILLSVFSTLRNLTKTWMNNNIKFFVLDPKPAVEMNEVGKKDYNVLSKMMPLLVVVLVIVILYLVFYNG